MCRGRPVHSPQRQSWVSADSAFLSVTSLPPRLPTHESERVPFSPAAAPSHTIDRLPRAHPNSPAPSPTRRTLDSRNPKARPILPRVFPRDSHPCLLRNASRKKWTLLFGPFNRSSRPLLYASSASFFPSSSPVSSAVAATSPATISMAPTTDMAKSVLSPPKPNIVCAIDTGIKRSAMNMR